MLKLKIVKDYNADSPLEIGGVVPEIYVWDERCTFGDPTFADVKSFLTEFEGVEKCLSKPLFLDESEGIVSLSLESCDSDPVGYVLMSHDIIIENYGDLTDDTIAEAIGFIDEVIHRCEAYLRGDCYGICIFEDDEEEDSFYGFFGTLQEVKEQMIPFIPAEMEEFLLTITTIEDCDQ